jgi:pimeloyl-ACP methyl ester carboxylesterase
VLEYIEIDGLRLRVRKIGSGPPLLLINGLSSRVETWAALLDQMADRCVVAYDAPGVGASTTPFLPLSMRQLASIAEGVLDACGIESADVLGYSHGGAVAQQFAFESPARIKRMVLAATSCGVGSMLGDPFSLVGRVAAQWSDTVESGIGTGSTPLGLLWQMVAIGTWSSLPWLDQIETPTLVLAGGDDRFVPPRNGRFLASRIPNSRYCELPGVGHDLFHRTSAPSVAVEIAEFLRT